MSNNPNSCFQMASTSSSMMDQSTCSSSTKKTKRQNSDLLKHYQSKSNPDFICPICLEIFEETQVTKCGHSFCFKCITECLKVSERCPQCNHLIEDFFPNFLLNELVMQYKNIKSSEQKLMQNIKNQELQKSILNKCSDLDSKEIDVLIKALKNRKSKLEKNKQNQGMDLLKEFLEKTSERKQKQLILLQIQAKAVKEDYEFVKEKVEKENEEEKTEAVANRTVPNNSNENSTLNSETISVADVDMEKDGQVSESIEPSTVFNSIHLGECSHSDPKFSFDELDPLNSKFIKQQRKMNLYWEELENCYLDYCKMNEFNSDYQLKSDCTMEQRIDGFRNDLNRFLCYTEIRPIATLEYSKDTSNCVSSIEFDKDSEYFALAGINRKIKIYDYFIVVNDNNNWCGNNFPLAELDGLSKISCISWNPYFKGMMCSSDYDGNVCIWDAFLEQPLHVFQEHERRCWSVDFNKIDQNLLASGSDDCQVKLWTINMELSVTKIVCNANVCCVKFNPKNVHHLAFGSADHRVYYYDLRNNRQPLMVFKDHSKSVSFVAFLNEKELLSASTDNQVKLWNTNHSTCLRSFKGHLNEKNFVGLTTNNLDMFACGSENNSVYIYYKGIPKQTLFFPFEKNQEKDEVNEFVSTVCWKNSSDIILAANSQGVMTVLELV